ncbi:hypothetical protein QYF36_024474 [Acer negundo]|nr:hypothetical protein QYF36_024474 [Acer negundo]
MLDYDFLLLCAPLDKHISCEIEVKDGNHSFPVRVVELPTPVTISWVVNSLGLKSSPKFPGKVNNDGNKVLGKGKGCWTQKSRPKPRQPICNSAVKIGKYVGLVSKATTDTSSCEEDFRGGANLYVNKFKGECSRVENRLVDYLENGFQDIRLVRNKKSTYHKVRMDGGANDQTKGEPNEGSPNKMGFQGESQSSLEEGEAHSPIHHYDVVIKNQSNGQKVLYKQVEKDKSLDLFVDLRS